jgi:hypothetical protein
MGLEPPSLFFTKTSKSRTLLSDFKGLTATAAFIIVLLDFLELVVQALVFRKWFADP